MNIMKTYESLVTKKISVLLEFEDPIDDLETKIEESLSDVNMITDINEIYLEVPTDDYCGEAEYEIKLEYSTRCTDTESTWSDFGGDSATHDEDVNISESDIKAIIKDYFSTRNIDVFVFVSESSCDSEELSDYDF